MKATYFKHILQFIRPGGTSRGVLHTKDTYILEVRDNEKKGVGECALFRGLSIDDVPSYEQKLQWLCDHISLPANILKEELRDFPSIWFGFEQALLNLQHDENLYFPSDFTDKKASIKINGLIWMGDTAFMQAQIAEKLDLGFDCIKLKIGVNWESEKKVLQELRSSFSANRLELRVDANGAFAFQEAKKVLEELALLQVHSIEQPIKQKNISEMAALCKDPAIPVALDEELIGVTSSEAKEELLLKIRPQFLILKPSLIGGFSGTDEWITMAQKYKAGWWITSALESNIGLNAIAQYTFTKNNPLPQGLGTGALFSNNFESNLHLQGDQLSFR